MTGRRYIGESENLGAAGRPPAPRGAAPAGRPPRGGPRGAAPAFNASESTLPPCGLDSTIAPLSKRIGTVLGEMSSPSVPLLWAPSGTTARSELPRSLSSLPRIRQGLCTTRIYNVRRILEIDGKRYPPVAEAARVLGIAGTTVRRRLIDPKLPEYREIQVSESGVPVSVDGKVYDSISEVVRLGLSSDRFQAMRRLRSKSPRWPSLKRRVGRCGEEAMNV